VPRAVLRGCRTSEERAAGLGDLRPRHPVTRVGRIGVAAVAVVGGGGVARHVVPRHQAAPGGHRQQVRMLEAHAGIDDGDHDVWAARRHCPGRLDVQGRLDLTRRRTQVPLPDSRTVACDARCVERIARGGEEPATLVGYGVLDVALLREALRQLGRRDTGGKHHLRPIRHGHSGAHRQSQPQAQRRGADCRHGGGGEAALAEQRRVHPEPHDHARDLGVVDRGGALPPHQSWALHEKRGQERCRRKPSVSLHARR